LWLTPVALAVAALFAVEARPADPDPEPLEVRFIYGSEKKEWLNKVTEEYHKSNPTVEGRPVRIKLEPMGSGETIDALLPEDPDTPPTEAHLISPASRAYLDIGNARSMKKQGRPLCGRPLQKLVRSPVVIAMWEQMAKKLGWPGTPIGWHDIYDLAKTPNAWPARGLMQYKDFYFGHTNPESSNSGLIALLAQVYAATGKKEAVTVDDVRKRETGEFLKAIQHSVIHYGDSTGFFSETLFYGGPSMLSAAVLYENLVVESYIQEKYRSRMKDKVVAIYPKEGTFMSDHPVAIVERDWVTPLHRKAAEEYVKFLMQEEQQRKAVKLGFRPGKDKGVPPGDPLTLENGVDPTKATGDDVLESPSVDAMNACLELWKTNKKKSRVVLVIDYANNMIGANKRLGAEEGAERIIKSRGVGDWLAILIIHDDKLDWVERGTTINSEGDKAPLLKKVEVAARGTRPLYDAIAAAHAHLKATTDPDKTAAIIVLTDASEDTDSSVKLDDLLAKIKVTEEDPAGIRVYTFAYRWQKENAHRKPLPPPVFLDKISQDSRAKAFTGNPQNVSKVLRELAAF
jgi:Ca-activated chloride channel family protein